MGTKAYDNFADLITFSRVSGGTALRRVGYGDELVTNGTFDSDVTGWTLTNASGTATFTQSSGEATFVRQTFGDKVSQSVTCVVGKVYEVSCNLTAVSDGTARVRFNSSNTTTGANTVVDTAVSGAFSSIIVADATTMYFVFDLNANGGSLTIDNISVKEVIFDRASDPLVLFNHPANIPRIEYAADGTRKGLLIEEARTNLLLRSEEFDNTSWTKNNVTVTANAAVAPDGTMTADKLVATAGTTNVRYVAQTVAGGAHTISAYFKADVTEGFDTCAFLFTVHNATARFDLSSETVIATSGDITNPSIVSVGGGWFRCSASTSTTSHNSVRIYCPQITQNSTGDGTSGIYVWGAQLEAGAFPTSYIPTTGATATRSADVASIPVSAFGYNQGVGSLVVNANPLSATNTQYLVDINNDTTADEIGLLTTTSDRFRFILDPTGNTNDVDMTINGAEGAELFAAAWKLNNTNAAHGGVVGTTDTANTPIANAITLDIGTDANGQTPFSGHIKSIAYYPRRLSNAQLQELTA